MKDGFQNPLNRPKRGDAGIGEIYIGIMSLAFALIGYLDSTRGNGNLLLLPAILIPAWGLGYWISKLILKHAMWPRIGYSIPSQDAWTFSGNTVPRREKSLWIPIVVTALVGGLAVFAWPQEAANFLGIGMFVGLIAAYAYWFFFNGWREYPWKWLVLLFLALGFLVVGLPVRGDYFEVWPQAMLLNGSVWLGSGAATLCSYLRHAKPSTLRAE